MPAHLFTLPSGPTLPAVTGLPEGYPFVNTTDGQVYVLTAGAFVKKTTGTVFDAEVRQPGVLAVGQVAIPGTYVPRATTLREVHLAVGTAPAGSALTVEVRNGATVLATVSIAAAATTGSVTGLTAAIAAGTRVTYHVTAVGSTTAGSDLAVALVCS